MKIETYLDEDATEFNAGSTVYSVDIMIPKQETQTVTLSRDSVHGTITCKDKIHPALLKLAIDCVKDYIAKIYTQSSY